MARNTTDTPDTVPTISTLTNLKGKTTGYELLQPGGAAVLIDGKPAKYRSKAKATEALQALLDGELDGYEYSAATPDTDDTDLLLGSEPEAKPEPGKDRPNGPRVNGDPPVGPFVVRDAKGEIVRGPYVKLHSATRQAERLRNEQQARFVVMNGRDEQIEAFDTLTPLDPDTMTAEQRVARTPSDQLPPAPTGDTSMSPTAATEAKPKAPRKARALVGTATDVVKYDPIKQFPELADEIKSVKAAAKKARALNGNTTDAKREAVATELNDAVAQAYVAGLPITALGSLIGVSAAAARSRALTAAKRLNLDTSGRTTADGTGTRTPRVATPATALNMDQVSAKVRGRYGKDLVKVQKALAKAKTADESDKVHFDAMTQGISIVALGQLTGVSASQARGRAVRYAKAHDLTLPSKDDRKAARQGLANDTNGNS